MLRLSIVEPSDEEMLANLFVCISKDSDVRHFHPHPFTPDEARRVANESSGDTYVLLTKRSDPIGYGMLRGRSSGYAVPSLGIYVVPECRGTGCARFLMGYLCAIARQNGAPSIRLRVDPESGRAINLYKRLGFEFDGTIDRAQLVGRLQL
jgi:ribosomal protein S18 acetylase RimI-like enzyme